MPERDMRLKANKRILGTAANRDAYVQRKSVVLRDNTMKLGDKATTDKKGN